MTDNIFAAAAPHYWAAGLPAIPLHYQDKRPILTSWQRYADVMPTPEEQAAWLMRYAGSNIGLPLGPASGIVVLDVDTDDEKVLAAIEACVPLSPWKRVGKKGYCAAYKFTGTKTFRIKDYAGKTLIEHLSSRTQVVLPTSIHPDTKMPYVSNSNLWEVKSVLPELSPEIENLLRGMLSELGYQLSTTGWTKVTDWVPAGARDVTMTKIAGMYAHAVLRGERTLLEATDMVRAWAADRVEHVSGDEIDSEKGVRSLVSFLMRDVNEKCLVLPSGWDDGLTKEDRESMGVIVDDDNEAWTVEQIRLYLKGQFEQHERDSLPRQNAVEFALRKIAKSTKLTTLEREQVLRYIHEVAGLGVQASTLRKRVQELSKGEFEGLDHTSIAVRVLADFKKITDLKFWQDRFWEWNGSHWHEYDQSHIMQKIALDYGTHPAAKRSSDHKGIASIMGTLITANIRQHEVKGVNFANGVLLETGELVAHNPMYGFQYTLPFRYVPESVREIEQFRTFLGRCWGQDPDFAQKMDALQEALCATIFGMAPMYQRAFLLQGLPSTGKSQLLDIIQALVPDEGRTACPPEKWNDSYMPAQMAGKVLNYCGELSETKMIDGQKFKEIVDGTEMTVRHIYGTPFQMRPTCAHWFGSNHPPKTADSSAAFNRRWLIFTFTNPITTGERIPNIGLKIGAEEREGIAAWAIEALGRLKENREYTIPASHVEKIAEVARANNSVRFFIEQSGQVVITTGTSVLMPTSEMTLYFAYSRFCNGGEGVKPVGRARFRSMMDELANQYKIGLKMVGVERLYSGVTLAERMVA
jgi:putative DNA primase/helicase